MKHILLSIILVFACIFSQAAIVNGRVVDEDGDPLAYAAVVIKGTSMGTTTNAQGYYTLTVTDGPCTLLAQHIGYRQESKAINPSDKQPLTVNFTLQIQGYQLKDVVVKSGGEDPAYRIIRNAIKRREFHLKQLQTFQTGIYLKGVFRNRKLPSKIFGVKIDSTEKKDMGLDTGGKGVLYLCEEVADYYTQGKQEKLIIKSVKESGNPNGVGLGSVPPVVNFYENIVKVLQVNDGAAQGFLSPIASTALSGYSYKLEGEFEEGGRTIYKIKVTPKRAFERCFTGEMYISDEDWAVHSVQLSLSTREGLDVLDTLTTIQQYIPIAKDLWVIKSQVIYPTISLFGFDISGNFVTVYNNQKVNEKIPDSVFNRRITVAYEKNANKTDSSFWQTARPVKLEMDEERNYVFQDSTQRIRKDPARADSLRRKANNRVSFGEIFLGGISFNGKGYKRSLSISGVLFDMNYNTVEGLNYSPKVTFTQRLDTASTLTIKSSLRYGFNNTHFNAKGNIVYTHKNVAWPSRNWSLHITGGKYIAQLNNTQPVDELINTYATLVQQDNYFKIYERWLGGLQYSGASGTGVYWSASALFEDRIPLFNTTNYSFVRNRDKEPFSPNLPSELSGNPMLRHKALTLRAQLRYRPGSTYTQYPNTKSMSPGNAPLFTVTYEKGVPGLWKSVTDFDKWQFSINDDISLNRLGVFEYNVSTGGFLNQKNVQIPDMKHLQGNQYTLAAPYLESFQAAPYYRFSSVPKWYGEAHLEYSLRGLLTNKIPLLRQEHIYLVLGTNTFYAGSNNYYTEAFVGVDNLGYKLFRFLRIDYVRGWDALKNSYSGLRLGLKGLGAATTRTKDTYSF